MSKRFIIRPLEWELVRGGRWHGWGGRNYSYTVWEEGGRFCWRSHSSFKTRRCASLKTAKDGVNKNYRRRIMRNLIEVQP